jgi:hypothetical protein
LAPTPFVQAALADKTARQSTYSVRVEIERDLNHSPASSNKSSHRSVKTCYTTQLKWVNPRGDIRALEKLGRLISGSLKAWGKVLMST